MGVENKHDIHFMMNTVYYNFKNSNTKYKKKLKNIAFRNHSIQHNENRICRSPNLFLEFASLIGLLLLYSSWSRLWLSRYILKHSWFNRSRENIVFKNWYYGGQKILAVTFCHFKKKEM
jgi:hypothetical protein